MAVREKACSVCQARRARQRGLCKPCFRDAHPHFVQPAASRLLKDLRLVYAGKVSADSPTAVRNLAKLFEDSPGKFMDLFNAEETGYREQVEAAWAESERKNELGRQAKAADAPKGDEEELLPEEPVEVLIQELLEKCRGGRKPCPTCGR
jgi:hypothetical protein